MQNLVIIAVMLSINITAFTQIVGLSSFEVRDDGTFRRSFKTEQEAIDVYQDVIHLNGFDTLDISFNLGNNPVVFDSFVKDNRKVVNVGTIVRHEFGYDILFFTFTNKETYLISVSDNDGNEVRLIYKKKL
jgi:hypothetical protein